MKGEGNPFDILQFRRYSDVNLIIVMGEVIERSEDIFSDGLNTYIEEILFNFKWLGIIVASGLTVYFITFSMALVKLQIVNPITELSEHIVSPQDTEKINNYISALKRREYEREFKRTLWIQSMEKKRKAKMRKELNNLIEQYRKDEIDITTVKKYYAFMQLEHTYEVEQIDEVEEVRL